MASLLTGLYPVETQVHDNEDDFLSNQITTVAELAHQAGYHTSFFSGGGSILRNSGLQQGFEVFEDNIHISNKSFFRSALDSFKLFVSWYSDSESPFFSVIYIPDLFYINRETINEFGESRNFSFESQLEELDQNLNFLFSKMKKDKIFDSTYIFFIGLNGRSTIERKSAFLNVHKEMSLVPVLIKPPRKPRDEGLKWSVDKNISITDIGTTLVDLLELKTEPKSSSLFPRYSLRNSLQKTQFEIDENRLLYTEGLSEKLEPIFAFRKNLMLLLYNPMPSFYNTLTDNLELNPISIEDLNLNPIFNEIDSIKQKVAFSRPVTTDSMSPENLVEFLYLVNHEQWKSLLKMATDQKNQDLLILAKRNLETTKTEFQNPCLKIFDKDMNMGSPHKTPLKKCQDKNILSLLEILDIETEKDLQKKKAYQIWKEFDLLGKFITEHFKQNIPWQMNKKKREELYLFQLALHHPRLKKQRLLFSKIN